MKKVIILLIFIVAALLVFENLTVVNTPADVKTVMQSSNVYFADKMGMYVYPEDIQFEESMSVEERTEEIMKKLVAGSENSELITLVPENTKLLSSSFEDFNITIDLSKEFESEHPGGSSAILMSLSQIVLSLTEIEGVNTVSFKIEGETLEEFKGHISFSHPFSRQEYKQYIYQ